MTKGVLSPWRQKLRRFYQESWQGIPFTTFAHTHFFHLADAKFYSVFYEELFRRYQGWNDLPAEWGAGRADQGLRSSRMTEGMKNPAAPTATMIVPATTKVVVSPTFSARNPVPSSPRAAGSSPKLR